METCGMVLRLTDGAGYVVRECEPALGPHLDERLGSSLYRLVVEDKAGLQLAPVAISLRTIRRPGVGGACRSEGLVAGEHVPDRFRELDKVVWRLPIPLYDPDIPSTATRRARGLTRASFDSTNRRRRGRALSCVTVPRPARDSSACGLRASCPQR
jgi:hypothetical protein